MGDQTIEITDWLMETSCCEHYALREGERSLRCSLLMAAKVNNTLCGFNSCPVRRGKETLEESCDCIW